MTSILKWKKGYLNHRAIWAKNPSTGGLYFIVTTRRGFLLKIAGDEIGTYSREGEAKEVAEKIAAQAERLRSLARKTPAEEGSRSDEIPSTLNGDSNG